MKKTNLLIFAFTMLSHVLFAFDTDWDYGLDNGPEAPPDNVPIDNIYYLITAVAMICCYLVFKARKNRKQC
jgi:hypothetical protein